MNIEETSFKPLTDYALFPNLFAVDAYRPKDEISNKNCCMSLICDMA